MEKKPLPFLTQMMKCINSMKTMIEKLLDFLLKKYRIKDEEERVEYYKISVVFEKDDFSFFDSCTDVCKAYEEICKACKSVDVDFMFDTHCYHSIRRLEDFEDLCPITSDYIKESLSTTVFSITIYVDKDVNGNVPIFSHSFLDYYSDNLMSFIAAINNRYIKASEIVFISSFFDFDNNLNRIRYISDFNKSQIINNDMRHYQFDEIIDIKNRNTNSLNFISPNLLPDFFDIEVGYSALDVFFNKVRNILSGIYIFSITELKDNSIIYKNIIDEVTEFYIEQVENAGILYSLYKWIFNDCNEADLKYHLVHSHFAKQNSIANLSDISKNTLNSIKSKYKMYQRKKLESYLNEKERVEERIKKQIDDNFDLISNFGNLFSKNIIGMLTFYISVVIIGSLSDGLSLTFNREISIISYILTTASFLLLVSHNVYVNIRLRYFSTVNNNMIESYSDIFDRKDLEYIIAHVEGADPCKKIVIRSIILFTIIWVLVIACLLVLATEIGYFSSLSNQVYSISGLVLILYLIVILNLLKK
jgi:hypothetical protein